MTPVDMEALRAGQDPDLTAVRCARLPLPALSLFTVVLRNALRSTELLISARVESCARLRSAKFMPREGDDQRSDWKASSIELAMLPAACCPTFGVEEVALGGVTGANIAEWMMRAGQEAPTAGSQRLVTTQGLESCLDT